MPPLDHATLGASSAHRWMNCPGSIRLSRGIPKTSSVYADEGSAAHHVAEECLRKGFDAAFYLGRAARKIGDGFSILRLGAQEMEGDFEIDEEMAQAVQVYLDTIRSEQKAHPDMALSIERKFDLSGFFPGMFGTNDACLEEPFGHLIVYDYKHGAGYAVDIEENPQLMYYALGAYFGSDFGEVEIVIVQPRARHKDGAVRRWNIPIRELMDWAENKLLPAAKATQDPAAPAITGHWCRFCPAIAICPAMNEQAMALTKSDLATIPLPQPDQLTVLELVKILQSKEILSSWLAQVEAHAQGLLENGGEVPGFKLVQKKTIRRWNDETELAKRGIPFEKTLHLYTRKLRSPAQIEKEIKNLGIDFKIDDLIEKPEGGLTIAPESDRRPGVSPRPAIDRFDDF